MKNLRRSGKVLLIFVVISLLVLLILGFNHRLAAYRQLAEEAERVEARATMLQRTHVFLETQVAYATSEAYVERWAYEEGRWIREGDHLMVPFSASENTPTPTPYTQPTQQTVETWEVWRILFFEKLP